MYTLHRLDPNLIKQSTISGTIKVILNNFRPYNLKILNVTQKVPSDP